MAKTKNVKSLIAQLEEIAAMPRDSETVHYLADAALLAYIGDDRVVEMYEGIVDWYS